jgi:uncharacterized protein (TIGR02284 family)
METLESGLRGLLTRLADAQEGYLEGAQLADKPAVATLMKTLADTHGAHLHELTEAMARRGMDAGDPGSAMALVHKTILNLRALLSGLDEKVIPGIVDGERRIVGAYDEVIVRAGASDESLLARLTTQRATVARCVTDLERMEPSIQP